MSRPDALHANRIAPGLPLRVELVLIVRRRHPVACHPRAHVVVFVDGAIGLVRGDGHIRRPPAGEREPGELGVGVEGGLIRGGWIGCVDPPLDELRVGAPDAGIGPVAAVAVDRHADRNHVVRLGAGVLRGKIVRRYVVSRDPRARHPLNHHRSEDGVAAGPGRADQLRCVTLGRPLVEPRLIVGGVDAMHRFPSRHRPVHPDRGVQGGAGVPVHAERDHPVALRRQLVEPHLMLGCVDTVICLDLHRAPSCEVFAKYNKQQGASASRWSAVARPSTRGQQRDCKRAEREVKRFDVLRLCADQCAGRNTDRCAALHV